MRKDTQDINWSVEHAQTGESVVKHCTTAAVVVAGERASNRGIQIKRFTAAAHLSARHREGDGENFSLLAR